MSGKEIGWWLESLWYDLTHLATADIPSLVFRLFVLLLAVVAGHKIIRIVLRILWDMCKPIVQLIRLIVRGVWWVVSAPVRLPLGWLRGLRQSKRDRDQRRQWEMERQRQEQARLDEIADKDRQEREEYQRMKGMMNRLE